MFYDAAATDYNGVFVAQYDDDNNLISDSAGNILQRIPRFFIPNSGYLKQSTNSGEEAESPNGKRQSNSSLKSLILDF